MTSIYVKTCRSLQLFIFSKNPLWVRTRRRRIETLPMQWWSPICKKYYILGETKAQNYNVSLIISLGVISSNVKSEYRLIKSEYRVIKGEYRVIKSEYRVIKGEYRVIKSEYRVIKSECRVIKGEYRVIKSEYRVIKSEYRVMKSLLSV